MIVTVRSQHYQLTPSLKQFALENLYEPLLRIWRRTDDDARLTIELRELRGGDKQGLDKECRCLFAVPRGPKLVITEVTEDMRTSIHQARKRLLRRVRQQAEEKLTTERHDRKHYLAATADGGLIGSRYARGEDVRGARETLG
jgi:ribosome-associated translation inhibitor RaiA